MNRPTFKQLRDSTLPQAIGLCTTNLGELARYVNEAQERLMQDPTAPDEGFWFGSARYRFSVSTANPYIITPREVARVIALDVCRKPVKLRNQFYEFLDFGIGFQPYGCECNTWYCKTLTAFERETVSTLADLASTPQYIRVYPTDSRDVGKRVLIQGTDNNDQTVLSTDPTTGAAILGEYITLALPFSTSVNQFTTITGIQKDMTYGNVTFGQVDVVSGVELSLSTMQPSETTANYRKYYMDGLPSKCCDTVTGLITVDAQCRLDLIPVKSDPDYLSIPSIPALIEEVQFIRKSRMDEPSAMQMAERHHQRALQILFGNHDNYYGKTQTAITVPLWNGDKLRPMPV